MNQFAWLLDRLSYEPSRNNKLRLMVDFFRSTPDPERGYALAALTGALSFQHAKPNLIRALIATRVDPYLFGLSYDYVGDLSETVALLWPTPPHVDEPGSNESPLTLTEVVTTLHTAGKLDLPKLIAAWLDALDENGRWALLKLITGSLRVGVSARLAKTAVGDLGGKAANEIEEVWHGLRAPYIDLFAWVEGREDKPDATDPAPFHPAMLAHAIEDKDFAVLNPADFTAEWKWDGIRVQATRGLEPDGSMAIRLYSRTGEDVSPAFPDLVETLATFPQQRFSLDGELLVVRQGLVQPFGVLQQRLNRRTVSMKLVTEYPAHIRAYDLLSLDGEDQRPLPFHERRQKLEAFVVEAADARLDLSPLVPFADWDFLARARKDPRSAGAGADAEAIEGLMLKRSESIYVPGRPKGLWYKWKRDPFTVDAVLMYAQRGHGKRSSFYSDYTFGVWRTDAEGTGLVPVGKAYFGFTDEELAQLDKYVRNNTTNRFGPVREVTHGMDGGLVLEIAFEGLNRSTRHKSGVAMRFPRVSRIRWDKPAREADRIETLEALLRVS
ncbi:cisplatin damage response ATP-dependent DNA ligase [Beijerinckia sp. L45]|uniref:cisplatin damage response ATP-dependent DNA ligase n=1 Tax=Beijerinckia sp. L45 TaxID=1641855 RepID=UPI00131DA7C7|nr:cisplatin damage response ATP-dependent DNA ligase [Beijerinckia sp. L45]